jgi:3alpha(or 20beta)-hydroxysteroid dehydrogenase
MTHKQSFTEFKDKIILITGAAGGIGFATAQAFAGNGATVFAMDLPGSQLADSISRTSEMPGSINTIEGNVTLMDDWQRAIKRITQDCGGLDILVNNAGIIETGSRLEDFDENIFDSVMSVNVKGTFLGMKAVIPAMRSRQGGAIVNISSISGHCGNAAVTAYTASKHAVLGMTKCAALDLAEYGIRVNAVCPAPIDTPMVRNIGERQKKTDPNFDIAAVMSSGTPMNRLGDPDEVASAILFLASEQSSFITGAGLPVDGGVLAK